MERINGESCGGKVGRHVKEEEEEEEGEEVWKGGHVRWGA